MMRRPNERRGGWAGSLFACEPLEGRRLLASTLVTDTLVAAGATWRYLDTGVDPGAAWRQPSFNDSAWRAGRAELGYGDGDEATVVRYGASTTNRYITTWFRHRFDVTLGNRAQYETPLSLRLKRDDGAVVYLNGREVARSNMPTGTVGATTRASTNIAADAERTFYPFSVDPALLAHGANVLAVEVHQAAPDSADVSFDLQLTATRSVAAATDPFTIVMIPDTQKYVESYPGTFPAQTQWVLDHVASNRIEFVTHVGDVVENAAEGADGNLVEWQRADAAMDKLDGTYLPYSVALGNHDYDVVDSHAGPTSRFVEFFGASRYAGRPWYGGSSADQRNHYQAFGAAGRAFLAVNVQFEPTDADLAWARGVIDAHPGMPVILSTHAYLQSATTRSTTVRNADGNSGERVFQELVRSEPQIFMVLNGHFPTEGHRTVTNDAGQSVIEMVADYQSRVNGGDGFLRLIEFNPASDRVDVKTYSPTLNRFETDANSQFSFPLDFETRFNFLPVPPPPPPPPPPGQQTVTFQQGAGGYAGARDTVLRQVAGTEGGPTTSHATAAALDVDDDDPGGTGGDVQALLRFGGVFNAGGGPVPLGATIHSASLTLQVSNAGSGMRLHRMAAGWADAATWDGWTNGVQPDGVEALAAADVTLGAGNANGNVAAGTLTVDVTASVRAWATGAQNWGWVMRPLLGGSNGITFGSSEAGTVTARPKLTVTFSVPSASQAVAQQAAAPPPLRAPLTGGASGSLFGDLLAGPIGPVDAIRLRRVGLFD